MEKIVRFFAIAATAAALLSCAREEFRAPAQDASADMVPLEVTGSVPSTRTSFGTPSADSYPVSWSESGESVRLYERVNGASWSDKNFSVAYTPSDGLTTASFKFNIVPQIASRFDYFVVYPANGLTYQIKNVDSQDQWLNTVRLGTVGTQVPRPGSVDSRFTYLIGRKEGLEKQPSSLDVEFKHLMAYGKMTVRNLAVASTDTLSNIKITFNDKTHVVGFIDYRIDEDKVDLTRATASKQYIEINPKNLTVSQEGFDVWFAIAPMTIAAGESVTFSFTTGAGDVTKTVFIPEGKPMEFKRGRVLEFAVDMTGTSIPKKLQFDFSTDDGTLPSMSKTPNNAREWFSFSKQDKLGGGDYVFYNAGGCYHGDGKGYSTIYENANTAGYLGLPAIPGYRLSRITVDRTGATGASLYLEVVSDVASKTAITDKINLPKGIANPPSIVLTGTRENTVYWLHSLDGTYVLITTLSLEYEVAAPSEAHESGYDVFLLLGQSNMAGRADDYDKSDCSPIPGVYLFTSKDETAVYAAQPLLNMMSTIRKGYSMQKFNLGGPFGAKVYESTNRKVLLVVNARGGTPIERWLSDAEPAYFSEADGDEGYLWGQPMPNFFDEAVRRAKAASAYGTLRAVLWHQGEGNSSAEKAPLYLSQIQKFASDLRTALGVTADQLPFIVGELNYELAGAANLNPYLNQISSYVPNSACVSAEGCASKTDNTHFTKQGLTLLGERYATKYLEMAH